MRVFGVDHTQPKRYLEGTHRACSPAETLAAFRPLMARAGITRLANITGLDHVGLPVVQAIRPNSREVSVSQGKGLDLDSARASALMESLEGWHAEDPPNALRWASEHVLRRDGAVIDLGGLPRRVGTLARREGPRLWVEGWDLLAEAPCAVPFEVVSLDLTGPTDPDPVFLRTSNGLASGNHLLEATLHALCELVERDSMAAWRADDDDDDAKATQVDPATIDDRGCRRVLDLIAAAGLSVGIWDATSPTLGVPTYTCVVLDRPGPRVVGRFAGAGTHLSPVVALCRALTEALQSRLGYIAGSRDDIRAAEWAELRNIDELEALEAALGDPPPTRRFDHATLATPTFEGDLALVLDRLRGAGHEQAVLVDLTRKDAGVPVARVFVPGLHPDEDGLIFESGA